MKITLIVLMMLLAIASALRIEVLNEE